MVVPEETSSINLLGAWRSVRTFLTVLWEIFQPGPGQTDIVRGARAIQQAWLKNERAALFLWFTMRSQAQVKKATFTTTKLPPSLQVFGMCLCISRHRVSGRKRERKWVQSWSLTPETRVGHTSHEAGAETSEVTQAAFYFTS